MQVTNQPIFSLMASTRGSLASSFVFEDPNAFLNWMKNEYPALQKKYGSFDIRLSSLDQLKVGDTCFVAGEGSDEFLIEGFRKIENNRYSFALNNGCWEEVAKCFKHFNRSALPQSLKLAVQKLGFKQVKMQQNYILLEN